MGCDCALRRSTLRLVECLVVRAILGTLAGMLLAAVPPIRKPGKRLRCSNHLQSYQPRTKAQGKKLGWRDGWQAIWTLVKWRFAPFCVGNGRSEEEEKRGIFCGPKEHQAAIPTRLE